MKMDLANAISHLHYHHFHEIGLILCYFVFSWQFLSQNGYMPSHLLFLLIFVKKARHQIFHDPLSSQEYVKLQQPFRRETFIGSLNSLTLCHASGRNTCKEQKAEET